MKNTSPIWMMLFGTLQPKWMRIIGVLEMFFGPVVAC